MKSKSNVKLKRPKASPALTGSAKSAGLETANVFPQNYYRLVMQLEATPKNSELIHAALAAISNLQSSPEGTMAVIKLETVNLSHYLRPKSPNAEVSHSRAENQKP